jgi:hypothetical protein
MPLDAESVEFVTTPDPMEILDGDGTAAAEARFHGWRVFPSRPDAIT